MEPESIAATQLNSILENIEEAFVSYDNNFRVLYMNREAERTLHRSRSEMLGQDHWELYPDTLGTVVERVMRRVMRDRTSGTYEIYFAPLDTWFEGKVHPSSTGGIVVYFKDINSRKLLEHASARLIASETASRIQSVLLRNSNEDLQRFAYVASHDLREPLRHISSFTELLRRHSQGKLDPQCQEFMDFISEGVKRMQILIQDLLEFSNVAKGAEVFSPVDCNVALAQAMQSLKLTIAETEANITADCLPTVNGSSGRLTQIFQNLIGNAIKYRGPREPRIHISALDQADGWLFSVEDNGMGIEMAYAKEIFGLFKRLHSRGEYEGTGIGLALCKRIVERHGGRIWVESEIGQGSTFFFTIPEQAGQPATYDRLQPEFDTLQIPGLNSSAGPS
jgi:PAS domain S-box-containing protein